MPAQADTGNMWQREEANPILWSPNLSSDAFCLQLWEWQRSSSLCRLLCMQEWGLSLLSTAARAMQTFSANRMSYVQIQKQFCGFQSDFAQREAVWKTSGCGLFCWDVKCYHTVHPKRCTFQHIQRIQITTLKHWQLHKPCLHLHFSLYSSCISDRNCAGQINQSSL